VTHEEFQARYESDADAEAKRFDAIPVPALLAEIRAGRLGECHQIWSSLAKRATPAEANEALLAFLASAPEYLDRYHCAAALIRINNLENWQPVELSAQYAVARNLEKVRLQLESK
jgi:hypothetical protein